MAKYDDGSISIRFSNRNDIDKGSGIEVELGPSRLVMLTFYLVAILNLWFIAEAKVIGALTLPSGIAELIYTSWTQG